MTNERATLVHRPRPGGPLRSQEIPWSARLRVLGISAASIILLTLILVMRLPITGQVALQVGDVSPRDVVAPQQLTYVSQILTEQRRVAAANAVPDQFDPPLARIGREQRTLAAQILDFITSVRSDTLADPELRIAYLESITALDLTVPVIEHILTLSAQGWERVANEVQAVLELAMREEIRENDLLDERRKIPARVRLDMSDEDAAAVTDIAQDLLLPNSFFNAERTEQRRQTARESVEPVTTTVERNETILRAGDIVSEVDIEALRALGLQQNSWTWREVWSSGGFSLLLGLVLVYYLWRQEPHLWYDVAKIALLASAVLIFALAAKAALPTRTLLPYLFPYSALAMILAATINQRVAVVVAGVGVLLVGWLTSGDIELMTYALCGALVGSLKLRGGERLSSFAWAALLVMLASLGVAAAFQLTAATWEWQRFIELSVASLGTGLVSVTTALLGLYIIGAVFGITTPLQLLEISRPTHPLLRQLLLKAPGTYHHTLIVANMAERAAEAIGADALLTRVGAYYHDVGKTIRPYFFVENRTEGMDPHLRLDPFTSTQIIITHVKDGIDLARKYRLPQRIIDFIPEHQGTLLVSYFYHQAVQQAGSPDAVDKAQFSYPGPKPQSRETAITMLADGAEAVVRSRRPSTIEELDAIVGESIRNRLLAGQLDECPLTAADLTIVRGAFVNVLRGLHHPRIAYPTDVVAPSEATSGTVSTLPEGQQEEPTKEEPDVSLSPLPGHPPG